MEETEYKTVDEYHKWYHIVLQYMKATEEGWRGEQRGLLFPRLSPTSTLKRKKVEGEVLTQVGRQICRQAGSDSDRKLQMPTDSDGGADRPACWEKKQQNKTNQEMASWGTGRGILRSGDCQWRDLESSSTCQQGNIPNVP